jgi:hypothetical protein
MTILDLRGALVPVARAVVADAGKTLLFRVMPG